ncbi:hypothetical protein H0H93_011423 [Arthromyces matolae]|nr:hypothetical protein H0H93_011423 [Arthromyces matolae]
MSVLNIGMNDISDHDRAMKDKLANAHIAALQEQLSKKAEELQEINKNHNDSLRKPTHPDKGLIQLVDQNTRIAQLEDDIKAQSSLTTKEKMSFQNAEQTLAGARATIKEREMDIKELELKLDDLSRLSDEHRNKSDKLTKEKSMLEIRVKELQATSITAPPVTPLPRRRRSPSPSPASDQLQALKHELTEIRSIVQEKEAGALAANHKASRAHEAQVRLENEKAALEKKLTREITALKVALQEKEDEMRSHDTLFVAEARHREQELEERIESDDNRIRSLQSELKMAENSLRNLTNELEQSRTRNVELFVENERVSKELKEAQRAAEDKPRNGNTTVIDDEAATHLQRLLSATSRLRAERDTLRTERDDLHGRLEFLQAESKFKIEAMHAAFVTPSTHSFAEHHTASFPAGSSPSDSPEKVSKLHRLTLATMAFATAVQHLDTEARVLALRASTAESCCVDLEIQLTKSQIDVAESHHKLRQMAVESNVESLAESSRANDELRLQLDVKSSQLAQAIAATKGAEDAQEFYKRQYDDVESQRSSLALEVTNLTNELSAVRNDVKMAEDKYTELQRHQFDTMSKTDRMRLLQNELKEERGRVERRDEHIKMLQHDIARMETTVVLHEERLNEMTAEFDSMAAAKEAMVEDCAEARDARDNALLRLEQMEVVLEAHVEEG